MKIIFTISCFFILSNTSAQFNYKNGFIITSENDTISGLIKEFGEVKNSNLCIFKSSKNAKPIKYTPSEINGYSINNTKYYLSKKVEDDKGHIRKFLNVLLESDVSLFHQYKLRGNLYFLENRNKKLIYLENEDRKVAIEDNALSIMTIIPEYEIKLYNKIYQDSLYNCLKDCKKVVNHVLNVNYNDKSLINFVKEYNIQSSKKNNPIIYEKDINVSKRRFGIFTGIRVSRLIFNEEYSQTTYPTFSFPFGILYNIPLKPITEKLSIQLEALGNFVQYKKSFLPEYGDFPINIGIASLEFPIMIKYEFSSSKFAPSIAIGKDFNRTMFSNTKLVHPTHKTGLFIDLGFSYRFKNNRCVFTSLRLNTYNGLLLEEYDDKKAMYKHILGSSIFNARSFSSKMATCYVGYKF